MITFDGKQYTDAETLLLTALTLATVTGQAFEITDFARRGGTGVTPLHLLAMQAMQEICGASVRGAAMGAHTIRFAPEHAPKAVDIIAEMSGVTGRPSPIPVTRLIESLLVVLSFADGDSLVQVQGVNAAPDEPSAFWLRESYVPTLERLGLNVGVEIERWGWQGDSGGICTLSVSPTPRSTTAQTLSWTTHDPIQQSWAVAVLSPRFDEQIGRALLRTFVQATQRDPLGMVDSEIMRVRSTGPGCGLFVVMQGQESVTCVEAISDNRSSPDVLSQQVAAQIGTYAWSRASVDGRLARALMVPLALRYSRATLTISDALPAFRPLEQIIEHFVPCTITGGSQGFGGLTWEIQANGDWQMAHGTAIKS